MNPGGGAGTKAYVVCGQTSYRGHRPGERFEADLTDEEERRAVERGSIKAAKAAKSKQEESSDG